MAAECGAGQHQSQEMMEGERLPGQRRRAQRSGAATRTALLEEDGAARLRPRPRLRRAPL